MTDAPLSPLDRLRADIAFLAPSPRALVCGIDAIRRIHEAERARRGWGTCTTAELGELAQMRAEAVREAGL